MKRIPLLLLLVSLGLSAFAKTWVITNVGFTFSPATLTIQQGDSVRFTVASIHEPVEVSETTWNQNDDKPLPGFNLPNGGGLVLPSQLGAGTHWYVCSPHASSGMKGIIIVENTTGVSNIPASANFSIFPNPTSGKFKIALNDNANAGNVKVEVYSILGNKVYAERSTEQKAIYEIDLTGFDNGVYLVKVYNGSQVYTRKMLVQ